jgi:hypothetical protein
MSSRRSPGLSVDEEFIETLREFLGLRPIYFNFSRDDLCRKGFAAKFSQGELEEAKRDRISYERWRARRREVRP